MSITFFVNDYFDRLPPVLVKLRREIRRLYVSTKRTLVRLTQTMTEYNKSMIIDGDFVRYMYILDVFRSLDVVELVCSAMQASCKI